MKLHIFAWHGWGDKLIEKVTKLFPAGEWDNKENWGYYVIEVESLDKFLEIWKEKFMFLPSEDGITIGITQYNSFSQR